MAERYITEREFPDKAIDILDEVGSKVQLDIKYPKSIEDLKKENRRNQSFESLKSFNLKNMKEAAEIRDTEKKLVR